MLTWQPDERRPDEAEALAQAVRAAFPGVQVKLTWAGAAWRVRALAPAAMCGRGTAFAGRDAGEAVTALLEAHGLPVTD